MFLILINNYLSIKNRKNKYDHQMFFKKNVFYCANPPYLLMKPCYEYLIGFRKIHVYELFSQYTGLSFSTNDCNAH